VTPNVIEAALSVPDLGGGNEPLSLAEKAYRLLVYKITRLELAPGEILAEKVLMAELGIGRTPIREALQRLAIEGLVSHLPKRGMLVGDISAATVQQIYEFRALIEGFTARLAATRADAEDIRELTHLHEALAQATGDDNVDGYVDLDRQFHETLARAARNAYLEEAVPRIFNLHLRLWFFISRKTGGWHPVAHAHDEMTGGVVDALNRRDPEAAELAMKSYISRRHQELRGLL
jgi:DNA-binding GntR family transcriptional regulator